VRVKPPGVFFKIEFRSFTFFESLTDLRGAPSFVLLEITENGFLLADSAANTVLSGKAVEEALVAALAIASASAWHLVEGLLDA
jgi:hypothetical protein